MLYTSFSYCCFQWFKDTNLKANHNTIQSEAKAANAVSNGSKILIWKLITTNEYLLAILDCCFQWFKDTNLKANHNFNKLLQSACLAVSNGSKILIWKLITTIWFGIIYLLCCFQWFKDTNLKANHNIYDINKRRHTAVSNGSKILIWKLITTRFCPSSSYTCCFQWFKDTNLKANHNYTNHTNLWNQLFPMVQRY